jgi:hypothetical protein
MGQNVCKVNCDENQKQETDYTTPRAHNEAKIEQHTIETHEVLSSAKPNLPMKPTKAWEVSIERPEGASLGLELRPQKYMQNYIVVGIILEKSEVMNFNTKNPDQAVKTGDRIVQVNGVKSDPRGMVDVFFSTKGAATFKISLERYDEPTG